MLTQSELEREKYEARLKYQHDEATRQHELREAQAMLSKAQALLQDAEQRSEQRGEQRGELVGRVQLAERLLKQEATPKETLRAMTLEQLHELADRLEAQLVGRS
jgi:hypothetical protein